ncbi:asr3405 [Nostoc sp. PCC 7120 = FACHB-418]|nr:asr3405 [Nostoc sp. PCC 7120 = FACHB-418]
MPAAITAIADYAPNSGLNLFSDLEREDFTNIQMKTSTIESLMYRGEVWLVTLE